MSSKFLVVLLLATVTTTLLPCVLGNTALWGNGVIDSGTLSGWDYCPLGKYAVAARTRIDPYPGMNCLYDNTNLNTIQLGCDYLQVISQPNYDNPIKGKEGFFGIWSKWVYCPSGFTGFRLKYLKPDKTINGLCPFIDKVGAVGIQFFCNDKWVFVGKTEAYGEWLPRQSCNDGEVVCGIQTLVLDKQGDGPLTPGTDDTALNDVNMKCCTPI